MDDMLLQDSFTRMHVFVQAFAVLLTCYVFHEVYRARSTKRKVMGHYFDAVEQAGGFQKLTNLEGYGATYEVHKWLLSAIEYGAKIRAAKGRDLDLDMKISIHRYAGKKGLPQGADVMALFYAFDILTDGVFEGKDEDIRTAMLGKELATTPDSDREALIKEREKTAKRVAEIKLEPSLIDSVLGVESQEDRRLKFDES